MHFCALSDVYRLRKDCVVDDAVEHFSKAQSTGRKKFLYFANCALWQFNWAPRLRGET